MKTTSTLSWLALVCAAPSAAWAQDAWQLRSSVTAFTGHYADSVLMKNQDGLGVRLSAEKDQTWGLTVGAQSSRIGMQAIAPSPQQHQDDWLLSGFVHMPSASQAGRWTFQLDAYHSSNDAAQSIGSRVDAWAPQITWLAGNQPLKIDLSYARSKYKNTHSIRQVGAALAYGFNEGKDWVQLRSYNIDHLPLGSVPGQSSVRATDMQLTHFLASPSAWAPKTLTLGLERGKKIYAIDMVTQTLYNLPMLNLGGENITASWKLAPQTDLNLRWSQNTYRAELPWTHRFKLQNLSLQLAKTW